MSASIELVTSHQGTPHITTDQVRDLLAGFSGDVSGIKKFPDLDNGLAVLITDLLEVGILTGQGLAGGYHFQLTNPYTWQLDVENVGYSRIDVLYLVIYEDSITTVQSADFVYQKGTAYVNGTTGTEPSAPTGTNIKDTFKFLRADITDGAIVTVTDYAMNYLSNKDLSDEVSPTVAQVTENTNALNGLRFGIDSNGKYGYYKVGADTVTPFRNPTGNAERADVLYGKTFSSATRENVTGLMNDFTGGNLRTITPSGGAGYQTISLPEGKYDSIRVNKNSVYNSAQSLTWVSTFPMGAPEYFECSCVKEMTVTNSNFVPMIITSYDQYGNSIGAQTVLGNATVAVDIPVNARYLHLDPTKIGAISVTYQTKQLRGL